MSLKLSSQTLASLLVDATGRITQPWVQWLLPLSARAEKAPEIVAQVRIVASDASIVATPIWTAPQSGMYRVSWFVRIVRAAGIASSVTVTWAFTDGAVACAMAGTAVVGNTTATVQGDSFRIRSDAGAAITYATAYVTAGVPTMQYDLELRVEAL